MTLTRLVLAWLPVAVEFTIVGGLVRQAFVKSEVLWRSLEAAAVTLFASLWFDSLGHGGWWLLFLLLGLIVSLAGGPERAWQPRQEVVRTVRETVRYLVAGAILAWRLR